MKMLNLMLMTLKMFVLVFIGMTSVFLPESCQGGDMIWIAWWRRKQKIGEARGDL
jgi:hypothetical protein